VITLRTVIHDRRIEIPARDDLADGTEVILTIGTDVVDDDGPMSPAEITRVLAAMERMQPLEIPDEVTTDLDAWEKTAGWHFRESPRRPAVGIFRQGVQLSALLGLVRSGIRHDWSELHYVVCAKPWSVLFVTTDSIRVDSGQQAGLIRSHLVL
jgi:hypothetical protein